MKVLTEEDLHARGIRFSRAHRHRLVKAGAFPRPIKIGLNTNVWLEEEIDSYIAERAAQRQAHAA